MIKHNRFNLNKSEIIGRNRDGHYGKLKISIIFFCIFRFETNTQNSHYFLSSMERTFICIKPESVQRSLVGRIIERFEDNGFQLLAMKLVHITIVLGRKTNKIEKNGR